MGLMDALFQFVFLAASAHASSVNFTSVDIFQTSSADCTVRSQCLPMVNTTCLGTTISHTYTSHVLANDSGSLADIHDKLTMWQGLQYVPKCWEVVQPFLCAVYMPKCEDGKVQLPSYDMCSITRNPCKIVDLEYGWPDFLECDNTNGARFPDPQTCPIENVYEKVQFNTSGECEPPLVKTNNERSWYKNVEGCGIQCYNPLYTDEEHHKVHTFIAVFATMCLVSTFFTLMTFIADWKNSSKYPALILFYMNGCFFVGSIGFLAQFPTGAREDIICREDGTMRLGEPSEGENLSCAIVFVIVYYFIIAGCIWFVNLSYSWHLSFRALGSSKDALQGITAYMHIIAWCTPLVMVVIILAVNQVDGDSVAGICFVGYQNHYYRAGFVLLPLGAMLVIGGFFLVNGLVTLCNLERDNPGLLNDKASSRINSTIARIGIFAFLAFAFVFITFACHLYEFTHQASWEKGFQDYLVCEANVTILGATTSGNPLPVCALTSRPNLSVVLIHLFSMFGAGIAMSMWVWTPSTVAIWKRFWRKVTRQPINEPLKLKKSRMIAKAFAKKKGKRARRDDDDHERLSVSFEEVSHDDAIGMKFDLPKSSVSSDSSSVFGGNGVPTKLLSRRGATCAVAKTPESSENSNTVQADVVIEAPPPSVRRNRHKKSKHKHKGSVERPKATQKKPTNMAFIEEEDEEAMARYEEEEAEEHAKIVSFMQGYRKSRENTPEEFQFMPGQAGETNVPMLQKQPNEFAQETQECETCTNCMQEHQQGYHRGNVHGYHHGNVHGYHQGNVQQGYPQANVHDYPLENVQNYPLNYPLNYPQDYPQGDFPPNYLQGYPPQGYLLSQGMEGLHQQINGQYFHGDPTHTQEGFHHDYPGQITSDSCHDNPEQITSDDCQDSQSEYYAETDDDVELPPHLCGSATPEEVHQFGLVRVGPNSIAARKRPRGHHPRGQRPMGHLIVDDGGKPGQYMFDTGL